MLNKCILQGRVCGDIELRHTTSNIAVTAFRLACDRDFKKDGERQTDFIDIVAWRNTAEFVSRYFKVGSMAIVEGSLQTRSYEAKDGTKRRAVEVVAENIYFGESKRNDGIQNLADNSGFAPVTGEDEFLF